jgi:hypothetical protein
MMRAEETQMPETRTWAHDEALGYWSPDLTWYPDVDAAPPGHPACVCSQCALPIADWADLLVLWHGGAPGWALRLHAQCFLWLTAEGRRSRGFLFQDLDDLSAEYWRTAGG